MLRDRGDREGAARLLREGIELLASIGGTEPQVTEARKLLVELER